MRKRELLHYQRHYQAVQQPKSYKPSDVKAVVQQSLGPLGSTHSLIEQAKQRMEYYLQRMDGDATTREFMQIVKALRDLVTSEVSIREEVRNSIGSMTHEQLLAQVRVMLSEGVGGGEG